MKKLFLPFQPNFPLIESTMESFDIYGFLNKVVERVNELQDKIEQINIDEILQMLEDFKVQIHEETEETINQKFEVFQNEISILVQTYLANYTSYFNESIEILKNDLEEKIEEIELGEIDVLDPSTGQVENINIVLSNLYDLLRNGITATEFDSLELTATAFDALEITAYDFDFKGKEILINE